MNIKNFLKAISVMMVSAVTLAAISLSAFAIKDVNVKDNGDSTVTVTASDVDKIAVTQYDRLGFIKTMGISTPIEGTQSVTVKYDSTLPIKVIGFNDWDNLVADTKAYTVGNDTLIQVDFEGVAESAYIMYDMGAYTLDKKYATTDRNGEDTTALLAKSKEGVTPHTKYNIQFSGASNTDSDFVVFEYDVMANEAGTTYVSYIKAVDTSGTAAGWHVLWKATPNDDESVTLTFGENLTTKTMTVGGWYRVAGVADYSTATIKYYFDGEYVATGNLTPSIMEDGDIRDIFYISPAGTQDYTNFTFDNIRVYEGTEPRDYIKPFKIDIDVTQIPIVQRDETTAREVFGGKYLLHTRNGVATDTEGNKTLLETKPYEMEGTVYVNAKELCEAWGVSVPVSVTDETVKLSDLAAALGLNVYELDAEVNSGLLVVADSFTAPDGDLQALSNYGFYLRASAADVTARYKASDVYNVHPRILVTQDDFDRIKAMYDAREDEIFVKWANQVIGNADSRIGVADTTYQEVLSSGRTAQRQLKSDIYALAMAYHLTLDEKYVDEAFNKLNTFCNFSDWKPSDHLHIAETMDAFAIGYDWLYHQFTPEERKTIEDNMYDKGFANCYLGFRTASSAMTSAYIATNNHGTVCNGSAVLSSAAFLDVFPEECAWFISNAMKGMEFNLDRWNNGAWWEGPHYWEYAMIYTVKYLASLEDVLGTTFGFEYLEGLDEAAENEISMQSTLGIFNYADAILMEVYPPEMLWLAEKYNDHDVARKMLDEFSGTFSSGNRRVGEMLALALVYYNPDAVSESCNIAEDMFHEGLDVATMRESWENNSTFVGIKGGVLNHAHSQLDSGSFIFESGGIRWIQDMGMGPYVDGYFDSVAGGQRWFRLPARGEGHSTVTVNPADAEDMNLFDPDASAQMTKVAADDYGAIVKMDMSEVLYGVETATRGYFFTDNRQSLVVRDEIFFTEESSNMAYENFDGKTTTNFLGTSYSSYEIVSGENYKLEKGNDIAKLTGRNEYINNHKWNQNAGTKHVTYELDVYMDDTTDRFSFYPGGNIRYGLRVGSANSKVCVLTQDPKAWTVIETDATVESGKWYTFAVEYDMENGKMLIYMDGDLIYTQEGLPDTNAPADHSFQIEGNAVGDYVYLDNIKMYRGGYNQSGNTVYWHLITDQYATVVLDEDTNTVTMTKGSKPDEKCTVEYVVTGGTAVEAIYENPIVPTLDKVYEHTYKYGRVKLKITGIENIDAVTITAKVTPGDVENATPLSDYTGGISTWSLPAKVN